MAREFRALCVGLAVAAAELTWLWLRFDDVASAVFLCPVAGAGFFGAPNLAALAAFIWPVRGEEGR